MMGHPVYVDAHRIIYTRAWRARRRRRLIFAGLLAIAVSPVALFIWLNL